jgi:menaquinone-dependent protoporphyrinogen oxidase
MSVLVAYATRHGATRGIAERIGDRLRAAGLQVDTRPASEVHDATAYDAFVVGSAAYMFHWLHDAVHFVERNHALLASRPTWLFSSGPLGTDHVDAAGQDVLTASAPNEFADLRAGLRPRGEHVFFGAWDSSTAHTDAGAPYAAHPSVPHEVPEGDFRDWHAIDVWADGIATELVGAVAGVR